MVSAVCRRFVEMSSLVVSRVMMCLTFMAAMAWVGLLFWVGLVLLGLVLVAFLVCVVFAVGVSTVSRTMSLGTMPGLLLVAF